MCIVVVVWFFTSQSTAMVMSERSVHLTTLFSWVSLTKQLTNTLCSFSHLKQTTNLLESVEGRRMTIEIISWSISMKIWDWVGIELLTPGSAVRQVSAARHFTYCVMQPVDKILFVSFTLSLLVVTFVIWADNLCKQFSSRSGRTKCRSGSGSKRFDTRIVFLKDLLKNINFEKKQTTIKAWKITQHAMS